MKSLPYTYIVAFAVACSQFGLSASAQGTLFRWSANPRTTGGPDLNEPLVTDRPDFTEASTTVGVGVIQLEIGYTYTFDQTATNSTENNSYGEPLFRIGMFADWFEFRLAWNHANEIVTEGVQAVTSGSEDLYVGAKLGLTPQSGILPEMALIPQMTLPTASTNNFGSGDVLPGANWIYAWEVTDNISTAGSSQFNRAIDATTLEPYIEFAQSWTIGYALTERLGAYTEVFGLLPTGADTVLPQYFFNGGFTYLLTDNLQFDIRGGVGLNNAADDYFVGTGLSIRYY